VSTIKAANCYRLSRRKDYVSDYLVPTPYEFQKAMDQYRYKVSSVHILTVQIFWDAIDSVLKIFICTVVSVFLDGLI